MRTISHLPGRIALPLLVALALLAPDAGAQGAQRKQQILFDEIPEHAVGDQPFDIAAKATSGLPLSFVVVSGPAVLDGRKVKLTGAAGLVIIRASQDEMCIRDRHPTERTLYWRHMKLRRMFSRWDGKGPTAVVEHGANPGLISHFTRQGLIDIANTMIGERKAKGRKAEALEGFISTRSFNHLAMELGVKVIHCSERDTQITDVPKQIDEFVNTWSIEGFREEGTTTAELGWGTHEKTLPAHAYRQKTGPKNQICIARMGINTWVRSWVPNYTIHGMVVRHGEAFTISDSLTVWKGKRAVYRPTVHYAYCPCDEAVVSLNELRGRNYGLQPKLRIMNDEITKGADILGALIMGHRYKSWWVGSDLTIEESRRLVPHQNATTMQVAISVVAATKWMIANPEEGVRVPDELPHEYILEVSKPYLGNWISVRSDWTPLRDYKNAFSGFNKPDFDHRDPWQFKNFLVKDGD